ncbi:MAG: monovalent cation/H+ antiporter subunit D family protein [Thermodesulfobacteriota bacterium]
MTEPVIESLKPVLALLCPALASMLILLSSSRPNLRETWTLLASIFQFVFVFSMAPLVCQGYSIEYYLFREILPQVHFGFRVDAFGLLFAITASFLWILVSLYSIGYMKALKEHAQTRYYFCFALAILGAMGVALSGNLVTLFVFYEILTISTYPLVAHEQSREALFAGRKYLAYLLTSGVFLLASIAWTYSLAGNTDFSPKGIFNSLPILPSTLSILFVLFILGFMKAAYIPFHSWLPTAMVAPTPVSALLHAVAVVKAGVFGIVRLVCYVYGIDLMKQLGLGTLLSLFAAFTMIGASLLAIAQDNLKRRLAYSTISQLSYIIFGVGLLTPMGITGAMIHIPFHGFMKITLFLCAGAILVASGKTEISEMAGIGRSMPLTMIAFIIGALGMCGAPPIAGFISKWYLSIGAIQSGYWVFLALLLIASLLDVVYFYPIIRTAFFEKIPKNEILKENEPKVQLFSDTPPNIERKQPLFLFLIIPIGITAILSILFCLFPNLFYVYPLIQKAIQNFLGG